MYLHGMTWLLGVTSLMAAGSEAQLADAAKKLDKAAVRALLDQHVDVNASQVDGTTALHWAAERDDLETAAMLVRAGANVKAANRYGVTPLSLACTNGSGPMIELLLKAGADPNAALPGGETAVDDCSAHRQSGGSEGAACCRRRCPREGTEARADGADVGRGRRARRCGGGADQGWRGLSIPAKHRVHSVSVCRARRPRGRGPRRC